MSKLAVLVEVTVDDIELAQINAGRTKMKQQLLGPLDMVENVIVDSLNAKWVSSVAVAAAEKEPS